MERLLEPLRDLFDRPDWQKRTRRWQQATHVSEDRLWWRSLLPIAFLVLMLWNWRLAAALLAGSFTMNAVFEAQAPQWRERWHQLLERLSGANLGVTAAVAGGLAAMLGTYVILSVWFLAGDRWLAIAIVIQGLVTVAVGGLVLWQMWRQRQQDTDGQFDRVLREMASPDSLQRLLAVRQVQEQLQAGTLTARRRRLAIESLQVVLERETVASVRSALLDALQAGQSARKV